MLRRGAIRCQHHTLDQVSFRVVGVWPHAIVYFQLEPVGVNGAIHGWVVLRDVGFFITVAPSREIFQRNGRSNWGWRWDWRRGARVRANFSSHSVRSGLKLSHASLDRSSEGINGVLLSRPQIGFLRRHPISEADCRVRGSTCLLRYGCRLFQVGEASHHTLGEGYGAIRWRCRGWRGLIARLESLHPFRPESYFLSCHSEIGLSGFESIREGCIVAMER